MLSLSLRESEPDTADDAAVIKAAERSRAIELGPELGAQVRPVSPPRTTSPLVSTSNSSSTLASSIPARASPSDPLSLSLSALRRELSSARDALSCDLPGISFASKSKPTLAAPPSSASRREGSARGVDPASRIGEEVHKAGFLLFEGSLAETELRAVGYSQSAETFFRTWAERFGKLVIPLELPSDEASGGVDGSMGKRGGGSGSRKDDR